MSQIVFTGLQPTLKGQSNGKQWFLFARSGVFDININTKANIWIVGGGCDGTGGVWNGNEIEQVGQPIKGTGTGTSYAGDGGDGGYVLSVTNVLLPKKVNLITEIADDNDKTGTTFDINNTIYKCSSGSYLEGGIGGNLIYDASKEDSYGFIDQKYAELSTAGKTGVLTPYGYVGSSGGGGAVCNGRVDASNGVTGGEGAGSGTNHRASGTSATNYGCGGGGGAFCGNVAQGYGGGKGKQGCVIIEILDEKEDYIDPVKNPPKPNREPAPDPEEYVPPIEKDKKFVIIRNFRRTTTVKQSEENKAAASSSSSCCCGTDNSGCDCNNHLGENSYSGENFGTVSNVNYTGNINIKSITNTDELALQIQNLETENLALLKQIKELESKSDTT